MRRTGVLLFALLTFAVNVSVGAAEAVPDLTRSGSISIALFDQKKNTAVSGGELTLYRVADVVTQNGNYSFQYTNGFENCGTVLDLNDNALAEKLYASCPTSAVGTAEAVDVQGHVRYDDLSAGLYLIVQTKGSADYETIAPFLVSLPLQEDDDWVYDVDATPKVGTVTSKTPDTPATPTPGTPTTPPADNRLPQTGQLNWPIPVLCVCGMAVLAIGWFLRKDENE